MMNIKPFEDVIGQKEVKDKLTFFAQCHNKNRYFPHTILTGGKGIGKTKFARELQKVLFELDDNGQVQKNLQGVPLRKKMIETNASSFKNLSSFINDVIIPYGQQKMILFLDEAHALHSSITTALLSLMPTGQTQASYNYNGLTINLDYTKFSILMASSEPQEIVDPLMDRMEEVSIGSYTQSEIAQIVQRECSEVQFKGDSLETVASMTRGNPRSAVKVSSHIRAYLGKERAFYESDWNDLHKTLGLYPLGLNKIEVSILKYLKDSIEGLSLTSISAKSGISREALQKENEIQLLKLGLVEIKTKGRMLTAAGHSYLRELEK